MCTFKGCTTKAAGSKFCCKHGGGKFKCHFRGCKTLIPYDGRGRHTVYCEAHEYEACQRLRRDKHLREKWLEIVWREQNLRCAEGAKTCAVVADGKATSLCPFGARELPLVMAQLDHIKPVAQEHDNSRSNLQVLCACCHAAKTAVDARRLRKWDQEMRGR